MGLALRAPQRRQVPAFGLPKIDWAHPLANGLIGCWLPGIGGGVNLAGQSVDLTFDSASLMGVSQDGPGLPSFQADSGLYGLAPTAFKGWTVGFSIYYRGYFTDGAGSANCDLAGISFDIAGNSPFVIATLLLDNSTPQHVRCSWNEGGSFVAGAGAAINTNAVNGWGGTFIVGGNVICYQNGTAVETIAGSFAAAPTSTANASININTTRSALTRFPNATCFIACMWNRALSADEQALIDRDPYGFLIPAEGEMPMLFGSVAPAPPDTSGQTVLMPGGPAFTRKKFRELMAAIRAAEEAADKAKQKARQKALGRAAEAARKLQDEAEATEAVFDPAPVVAALEAASGARKLKDTLEQSKRTIVMVDAMLRAIEEEDEEEAVSLLLVS